jgi:heme exporter protein A
MQLVIDNVSLERGGRRIAEGLSATVAEGEALLLTGPNGSGKTTLLRAIAGFVRPAEGAIRLDGDEKDRDIAERCHFVGHRDGVKAALTVEENARFWRRYLGGAGGTEPAEALKLVGLGGLETAPALWLSAGQRRRLGLVRLVLANRRLWLLDEPSVSLDAAGVSMLAGLVERHRADGGIVVAATHVGLGFADVRELRLGEAGL